MSTIASHSPLNISETVIDSWRCYLASNNNLISKRW